MKTRASRATASVYRQRPARGIADAISNAVKRAAANFETAFRGDGHDDTDPSECSQCAGSGQYCGTPGCACGTPCPECAGRGTPAIPVTEV